MHSDTSEATIAVKVLLNPGDWCTTVLAGTLKKQVFSRTVFDPGSYTSGILHSRIFGRMYILLLHCRVNQVQLSEGSQSRLLHGPNMAAATMRRDHIEPFSLRLRAPAVIQ